MHRRMRHYGADHVGKRGPADCGGGWIPDQWSKPVGASRHDVYGLPTRLHGIDREIEFVRRGTDNRGAIISLDRRRGKYEGRASTAGTLPWNHFGEGRREGLLPY